ncbi:hypothetical protein SARC_04577 [Sphaeroforma arctica JP610]|uniref:NF-X1-type domain-containing protein n=1 Tax=Sphaeroforma arctica JP610 TaxID=667725 RepID=A0A0L0G2X9_9EUKA|nr:hypothetical protein SARC_04577 [Sphaeroforma arctica JP610]KNC83171.1 hypothetical protein SARC_04577 [Sphaeroforma arctica JP610]|eukprot:XP_014157073.1 hypothetical protein SARC_04577 [Sphaeroforma arctica JP610]
MPNGEGVESSRTSEMSYTNGVHTQQHHSAASGTGITPNPDTASKNEKKRGNKRRNNKNKIPQARADDMPGVPGVSGGISVGSTNVGNVGVFTNGMGSIGSAKGAMNGFEGSGRGRGNKHLNANAPVFVAPLLMTPGDMVSHVGMSTDGMNSLGINTNVRHNPDSDRSHGDTAVDASKTSVGVREGINSTPDPLVPTSAKNSKSKKSKSQRKRTEGGIGGSNGGPNGNGEIVDGLADEKRSSAMTRAERMARHNSKEQANRLVNKRTPSDGSWRCPGCQTKNTHIPTRYTCFCCQTTNPDWDPYSTPHTCERVCKKRLDKYSAVENKAMALARSRCKHLCAIACHPGPCPPCELYTVARCLCNTTSRKVLCAELALLEGLDEGGVVCDKACGKLLNCSKHECQDGCHAKPCRPCDRTEQQCCYCGKTERTAQCGEGLIDVARLDTPAYFACDTETKCGRLLKCGKHRCDRSCHPGECYTLTAGKGDCPYSPENISTCACGKEALTTVCARKRIPMRQSCDDPRPTCEAVCGKPLPCAELSKTPQQHMCKQPCHTGPCLPCANGTVRISCRCGLETKTFACTDAHVQGVSVALRCKRMCQKKLHCKRHTCEERCCPFAQRQRSRGYVGLVRDSAHECTSLCKRTLSCGLHECMRECHDGACPPCIEASYDDLHCLCGRTMRRAPIPCNTPRPTCTYPCTRTHACTHPVTHDCHNEDACPPCVVLVDRECVGGHEVRGSIPCHMTEVSCGALCGRPLACGHRCNRKCHGGACVPAALAATSSQTATASGRAVGADTRTAGCWQACGRVRPSCGHLCEASCHALANTPCPTKCTKLVDVFCACGMRADKMPCAKVKRGVDDSTTILALTEHASMLDGATSHTKLPCNDRCTTLQRNYRLAQALDISVSGANADRVVSDRGNSGAMNNQGVAERQFGDILVRAYHSRPDFILSVEEFFAQTIKQYKEGKSSGTALLSLCGGVKSIQQLTASYTPISRYQVEIFQLLSNHYGLHADLNEYGKRMKMDVACDARSFVPGLLLSQLVVS